MMVAKIETKYSCGKCFIFCYVCASVMEVRDAYSLVVASVVASVFSSVVASVTCYKNIQNPHIAITSSVLGTQLLSL